MLAEISWSFNKTWKPARLCPIYDHTFF